MRNLFGVFTLCGTVLAFAACGSSSNSGVVSGAADTHCTGMTPNPPASYSCPTGDANAAMDPNMGMSDYGDTLYGSAGNDDDCKYHVEWSADNVEENSDVAFTVKATWLADGTPVAGAYTRAEVFLSDTHVAPNSNATTVENPNGTYLIKPIRFDEKGQWTVRFHFYENCVDDGNSLHGHAAFYVNVP